MGNLFQCLITLFTKILPYVLSKSTFFNFQPAEHTSCDAAQAIADFPGCKCSFSSPVHQDPKSFSTGWFSILSCPSLHWYSRLPWPGCKNLHLALLNFMSFTWAHTLNLSLPKLVWKCPSGVVDGRSRVCTNNYTVCTAQAHCLPFIFLFLKAWFVCWMSSEPISYFLHVLTSFPYKTNVKKKPKRYFVYSNIRPFMWKLFRSCDLSFSNHLWERCSRCPPGCLQPLGFPIWPTIFPVADGDQMFEELNSVGQLNSSMRVFRAQLREKHTTIVPMKAGVRTGGLITLFLPMPKFVCQHPD